MSRSYPGEILFKMDTPPSPSYRIFRDKHGIPQFEPKRGTQALKDALIYSFPTLETELQLMQAALRKFFDSEKGSTFVFELPERDLQTSLVKKPDVPTSLLQSSKASLRSWKVSRASRTPSRPSSRASSRAPSRTSSRCETPISFAENGGTMTTWMLSNGQELEKRKRQPYDPVKRRKVAENRGNACEKHRASKTAVSLAQFSSATVILIYSSVIRRNVPKINYMVVLQDDLGEKAKSRHMTHHIHPHQSLSRTSLRQQLQHPQTIASWMLSLRQWI